MRSHRRRGCIEHVLIAGGHEDLDAIALVLDLLPEHAYGQVYIEAAAGEQSVLTAPDRVTVTWLSPPQLLEQSAGVVLAPSGTLLTQAVTGWIAEWVPEEPATDREFAIWIGGRTSSAVNEICEALTVRPQRL